MLIKHTRKYHYPTPIMEKKVIILSIEQPELMHCLCGVYIYTTIWKNYLAESMNTKHFSIFLLSICQTEMSAFVHQNICKQMLISIQFKDAPIEKSPKLNNNAMDNHIMILEA